MGKNFGELSFRNYKFRKELLETTPEVCVERAILTTKAYKEHENKQIVLKRAYMVKEILENMTLYIEENTLIVGNQATKNRNAPIFPEYAMDWIIRELDDFEHRNGDVFHISDDSKSALREIYPYWKGRTLQDKGYAAFPPSAREVYDNGIIRNEGNITSGDAHLAVDYETVLNKGLAHYRTRIEEKLNSLNYAEYNNLKSSYFYQAMIIVIDAVETYANRFSRLALKESKQATGSRRKELIEISRICAKVPMHPAETFHEALQSLWFIHLILQIESNGHSLSFGRFDQYMYPFYQQSVSNGMTEDTCTELLENLWLKTLTINKIRSAGHSKYAAGSPLYQNITIGGQISEGVSGINELTKLTLYSIARTKLPQPNLTVRYFEGMDEDFMQDCIEVLKLGFGMPAFNSDVIIVPALMAQGVTKEDAFKYSAIGCVEVAVPGKWGYRCTGMSYLNFPKTLMIALNNGIDILTSKKICEDYGSFLEMDTFEKVFAAWEATAAQLIQQGMILDNCADLVVEQEVPDILCSTLVDDCIERGKHLKEGGAHYDIVSQLQVGVANLGDSLAALKKCVYEEKSISREELWDALLHDFVGERGEEIRTILLDAPKYGNDDDYVDNLVIAGYNTYLKEMKKYKNNRYGRGPIGGGFYAGTSSVASNVPQGAGTCATPDGRHKGDPLAEGSSPTHAVDKQGPTSVFKSVSKLPTKEIVGGVLLNQKLTPQLLNNPENCYKLSMLIRTFFDSLNGFHVQYNVVSKETLIDAQNKPENYKDLIVRVAGYSAFFTVLSTQTQNDIIARTEQDL